MLIDASIRTFIDLTEADTTDAQLEPYGPRLAAAAAMRRLDLDRINLHIPDRGVIADEGYDDIVAAIDAARRRGGVFVTAGAASAAPGRWSAAFSPPPDTTTPRSGLV